MYKSFDFGRNFKEKKPLKYATTISMERSSQNESTVMGTFGQGGNSSKILMDSAESVDCKCFVKEIKFEESDHKRKKRLTKRKNVSLDFEKMRKPPGLYEPPNINLSTSNIEYNYDIPYLHRIKDIKIRKDPPPNPVTTNLLSSSNCYPIGYINTFFNDNLDKKLAHVESHIFNKSKNKHMNFPQFFAVIPDSKEKTSKMVVAKRLEHQKSSQRPRFRFITAPDKDYQSLDKIFEENMKLIAL